MKSRKHGEYAASSTTSKPRNQHRFEVGHESLMAASRNSLDQSPHMLRRSLSPQGKTEGSRRVLLGERSKGSTEKRDYSWHLGSGRTEKVHPGSSAVVQDRKKPNFDEAVVHRKHKHTEDMDYEECKMNRMKQVRYDHHHGTSSRMSTEKNYSENRTMGINDHGVMGHKLAQDGMRRVLHQMPLELVPTSHYGEAGGHLPLSSHSMDISQFQHEKFHYREHMPSNKITMLEMNEGEKPVYYSRDSSYTTIQSYHCKDFMGISQLKNIAGTSSRVSRSEFPNSCREGRSLQASDGYPWNNVIITEPVDFNEYDQRSVVDMKNLETGMRIKTSYPQGAYGPNGAENDDYLYPRSQRIVNNDLVYTSDDLTRMLTPNSQLDFEHAHANYEHREMTSIMHPVVGKVDRTEDSYVTTRKSAVRGHPSMQKQAATEDLYTSRMLCTSKHGDEYLGSRYSEVDFGIMHSGDDELSYFGATQDQQPSHFRSDYGFGQDSGPQFAKEKLQDPHISIYDMEMSGVALKRRKMKGEELPMYEPSVKVLKRNYGVEEGISRHDTRTNILNKWSALQEFEHPHVNVDNWISEEEDESALHASRIQKFDNNFYRKPKRTYDGREQIRDLVSQDYLSSQDSVVHVQRHSVRRYKPNVKNTKGHPGSGSLSWHNSHHTDRRIGVNRQHKIWKRNDDDADENEDNPSEDWMNHDKSELSEDSEEFKQLVDEGFLFYSKMLNLNSAIQRRYKEQGKAGSLFCIVCGRSASKEFMDTQRLVTHAFMSRKVDLRARHLGLHKAICVLMGWNTCVPRGTITWVPDILPKEDALAQKQDLILWPPLVIIHNISMFNNNPEQQKLIPIDWVQAFLIAKGFVGGKMKLCLGKPADQSVILVKLVGTFTGMGIAQRLHKYFVESKRGREEFELETSNGKKSKSSWEAGVQDENLEEQVLYGYMGIAEDLDRVDFLTKESILIKSRKEIEDLANAPVRVDDC